MKFVALCVLSAAAGCSSGSENPPSSLGKEGPLYAISSINFGPSGMQTTTVAFLPSLAAGTQVDYKKALELPGGANLRGVEKAGTFYMLGGEAPTLTRYRVDEQGFLKQEATLNLLSEGITSLAGASVGFAGTKGYLIALNGYRGFVFDPSAMTITGRFDASALALGDMPAYGAEGQMIESGGKLFAFVYHTDDKQELVGKQARALAIDVQTDAITAITDDRCAGFRYVTKAENGDIYASSDTWTAIVHRIDPARAPEPCILRVRAGETQFDPTYQVKLSTLTGGAATGGLIPGKNGDVLVRALDEALVPVEPKTVATELFGALAWRTWRANLLTGAPGVLVPELAPNIAGILYYNVEGEVYTNETSSNYATTTFVQLTAPEGIKRGVQVNGVPFDLLRIR